MPHGAIRQQPEPAAAGVPMATRACCRGLLPRMVKNGWSPILFWRRDDSLPQNLLHRFSICQLIDELVQVADFSHQWIFDFFHAHTAHGALDQRAIGMKAW